MAGTPKVSNGSQWASVDLDTVRASDPLVFWSLYPQIDFSIRIRIRVCCKRVSQYLQTGCTCESAVSNKKELWPS